MTEKSESIVSFFTIKASIEVQQCLSFSYDILVNLFYVNFRWRGIITEPKNYRLMKTLRTGVSGIVFTQVTNYLSPIPGVNEPGNFRLEQTIYSKLLNMNMKSYCTFGLQRKIGLRRTLMTDGLALIETFLLNMRKTN